MPTTPSVKTADTVKFIPEKIPFPNTNINNLSRQSISDIVSLLNKNNKS